MAISARLLFAIRIAAGSALTIAGVLAALSVPGPLVPGVEGLLFIGLLVWAQLEYSSRRKDSAAFRQHLTDLQGFARFTRDSGFFITIRRGGEFAAIRPVDLSGPRARDFRAHFPDVARNLDEWNHVAAGLEELGNRFQGLTHRQAEAASDDQVTTALPMLLSSLGRGEVELEDITWRVENGQLEASWQSDVFGAPAFSQIIRSGQLTDKGIQRVWDAVDAFPNLPDVRDYRTRLEAARRLRPVLLDGLEHAEIAVELKGKCEHCAP
jgi:hypothetical protein